VQRMDPGRSVHNEVRVGGYSKLPDNTRWLGRARAVLEHLDSRVALTRRAEVGGRGGCLVQGGLRNYTAHTKVHLGLPLGWGGDIFMPATTATVRTV